MTRIVSPFVALFLSFGLLLVGGGLLGTLVGVRMTMEWFPTQVIGLVAASYSVGFVLATRICGRVIARVGHIRTFAALAVIAATSTLAYPIFIEPVVWGGMRLVYGFAIAGLYMVVESWLNDRTPPEYRGQVFGVYSVVTYVGLGGGQFLLVFSDPAGFELFSLSAALIGLALVPVTITRTSSPELREVVPVRLRELYAASPLGVVGCAAAGVINGSFLGMGPVYAKGAGFSQSMIAILMGVTIVGGFLLQYPIGRLSDLYNRRDVIATVAAAVAIVSGAMVALTAHSTGAVVGLSVLWGGLAFTLYPLSVSLTNDFMDASRMLGASAGLLLVHGAGMIAGPVATSQLMGLVGPTGLFWTLGATALALAGFALLRQRVGPPLSISETSGYQMGPSSTPYTGTFDPYAESGIQMEFDFDGDDGAGTADEEAAAPDAGPGEGDHRS
ncbi:putative MFS-type transporter YcaD [wastewater metagenome]|uniref:Putative MFS-type transporter YcaD n=3 Tax=root TaxID=1 RepID=A0A5B8RCT8_9ZZZZ|nr:MFS transporter [Arhodomonas aquaeolei]MCS4503163.1 MFS transporter [Arhodomonas aquaeolei]QEA04517.1 putative MFS-type transporter YcaD [uncultured organism]